MNEASVESAHALTPSAHGFRCQKCGQVHGWPSAKCVRCGAAGLWPKRIQRKRLKGWKMPEGAVYVGRPTKWGNPFRLGTPYALMRVPAVLDEGADAEYEGRISADGADHAYHHPGGRVTHCTVRYMTPQETVDHYRALITGQPTPSMRMAGWRERHGMAEEIVRELRGRDLACWCPTWQPCHADVLLEIANGVPS